MQTILFQGDSVTDAGRTECTGENLGQGYPLLIGQYLEQAQEEVRVINRGISGNRTIDLVERWQKDCLDIRPDVLTILIGINDCWRKYDSNDPTSVEVFEERLDWLLCKTAEQTKAQIILMEPFVLPFPEDRKAWRETLDPEIQCVRLLARKYRTGLVPLDGIMNQAGVRYGYDAVTQDGVHPTPFGHEIIAKAWLREYEILRNDASSAD